MNKRIRWDCIYCAPTEISRYSYYDYKLKDGKAIVHADGVDFEYTIEQLKDFFVLEVGTWDDVFKADVKKPIVNKAD